MLLPKPLLIAVVVTLVLFLTVIGVGFRKDGAQIVHATSWDRVKAYQYGKTPGLKRAEELGLTRSFHIKVPVPETDLFLSLYEVWYNQEHVYFFYSFERTEGSFGKHLKDREAPVLSFQATLPGNTENAPDQESYSLNWPPWEGAQHQGKYHQRSAISPFLEKDRKALVSRIKEIVLRQVSVRWGEHTYPVPELRLPMNVDMNSEQIVKVSLNHSHSILERRIHYERLDLGTSMNHLYFRFLTVGDSETLLGVSGRVLTDGGEERRFYGEYGPETDGGGRLSAAFPPFDSHPAGVSIILETVRLMDRNNRLQFQLNAREFKDYIRKQDDTYDQEKHSKLAALENTHVYLKGLYYDQRGIHFTIVYEEKKWPKKPFIRLLAHTPNSPSQASNDERLPMLVTAVNERGEPGRFGQRGSGGRTFGMFVDRTFIDSSEHMDITIGNLVKEIVGEWKVHTAVPGP
ncbi:MULTISPECIES: hypothetical protein [unclassified Paenibacillus]|uniref:hypothetical protein n=1 Tax=unclassified Paenibacillus TaxID=185978 RepID=UPI001AE8B8B7|nr:MULTISPECIES: hypothetical protein [unclassified Paenibacillus]MBP1153813.1 hypothetical protein [Paenibacillus sp. PvP091]MBP1170802.1 hypothetical protein [Paenibacillus sp. PvR098]MBP2441830.1 hypothetical protein [Paenibacillus sp. PvP052]